MKRIPFDIKYRPEIESGKYLVKTKDGKSVRIICWEKQGRFPIVALSKEREEDEEEVMRDYCIDGRYYEDETSHRDLFLVPNPDHNELPAKPSVTAKPSVDWDAFRREAAKDILCAIIPVDWIDIGSSKVKVCERAIVVADELIKQLKEDAK